MVEAQACNAVTSASQLSKQTWLQLVFMTAQCALSL